MNELLSAQPLLNGSASYGSGRTARQTIMPLPGRCTHLSSLPYSMNAGTLATSFRRGNHWAEAQTRSLWLTKSPLRPPLPDAGRTVRPRGPLGITPGAVRPGTQGPGERQRGRPGPSRHEARRPGRRSGAKIWHFRRNHERGLSPAIRGPCNNEGWSLAIADWPQPDFTCGRGASSTQQSEQSGYSSKRFGLACAPIPAPNSQPHFR